MLHGSRQEKGAKEPPVVSAEKLMAHYIAGNVASMTQMLDPAIILTCPMGLFHGRPHVQSWIGFEVGVLKKHGLTPVVQSTRMSPDDTKTAVTSWSIGTITFTDTLALNQVLLVRWIKRTWTRRAPKNAEEKELMNRLLLSFTGPHFESYCAPKSRQLDNRAMVLPVLDFSFCGLTRARDVLYVKPRDGKTITDRHVVLHYLGEASRPADAAGKGADGKSDRTPTPGAATDFGRKDEITIRAKNRDGEVAAILIDKRTLEHDLERATSSAASLEDSEMAVNEDRVRYAASGLRLCNNALTDARELDQVIRLSIFNAFFFLTWIDLSSNKLTAIPNLSQYPVGVLYLHDNAIQDWAEAKKLADLPQLQTLTLFGNALQENASTSRDYKFRALAAVKGPNRSSKDMALRTFDHSVLSPAERQNVDRYAATHSAGRSRPASRSM